MSEHRRPIAFTEVTLRDGEQQEKRCSVMPVEDRLTVFDRIGDTGIDRIEIGHLGNEHDQEFARALVNHIDTRSSDGDHRYDRVDLQVLFGSQQNILDDGIAALDGFDPDRVVVHVYDRASPNLRALAGEPYSARQSAGRVFEAAQMALRRGFRRFSVSGEGTVDPDLPVETAIHDFYLPLLVQLDKAGAADINVNMPNTFGSSLGGEWDEVGMEYFVRAIKAFHPDITTSIHVHNDHGSAVEYSLAAIMAGFDRVEGTLNGMGERAGNTDLTDTAVRLTELARLHVEARHKTLQARRVAGAVAVRSTLWHERYMDESVLRSSANWYAAARSIAATYDTMNRFHRSSLGNPEAYGAGAGPHAQANKEFLIDPVNKPLWRNYGRAAIEHAIWGRPEAWQIIEVNRQRIQHITLATDAAGNSSEAVWSDAIEECSETAREQAITNALSLMGDIVGVMAADETKAVPMERPSFLALA